MGGRLNRESVYLGFYGIAKSSLQLGTAAWFAEFHRLRVSDEKQANSKEYSLSSSV